MAKLLTAELAQGYFSLLTAELEAKPGRSIKATLTREPLLVSKVSVGKSGSVTVTCFTEDVEVYENLSYFAQAYGIPYPQLRPVTKISLDEVRARTSTLKQFLGANLPGYAELQTLVNKVANEGVIGSPNVQLEIHALTRAISVTDKHLELTRDFYRRWTEDRKSVNEYISDVYAQFRA